MDLAARVDVHCARVDVNFQTVTVTYFCQPFFFLFLIPINVKVLLILHTNFSQVYQAIFGEMAFNARVDVNFFRVDVNFQTAIVTKFCYRFFSSPEPKAPGSL